MTNYYLDLETNTEGRNVPDPMKDRIVTIQYRPYYKDSGKPKEPLTILKSWESSEKEILERFLKITEWNERSSKYWEFKFIPTGVNLNYDLIVIKNRCKELLNITIPCKILFHDIPRMELKTNLVMANKGKFTGASLDRFSNKKTDGLLARKYIKGEDWDNLLQYIDQEAEAFFEIYQRLLKHMPEFLLKI